MPNRLLPLACITIVALALAAAPAAGKGIKSAKVCGTDRCVAADIDRRDEQLIFGGSAAGPPSRPDARAEGFYRLEIAIGDRQVEETLRVEMLPALGYIHSADNLGGSEWMAMSPDQRQFFRPITDDLEAFPGTKLEGLSNPELPAATVAPAPATAAEPAGDDGVGIWVWVLAGLGGLIAAALVLWRRRVRHGPAPALR